MIDREDLSYVSNILSLNNSNPELSALYDILTALKEDDSLKFLTTTLHYSNPGYDTALLESVFQVIKDNPELTKDILDSFSNNQFVSKGALLRAVNLLDIINKNSVVVIWGAWYGSILIPALANNVKKIACIDIDNSPLQIAKNRLFQNIKNIDYICDDVFKTYRDIYLETNLIINTSCEHMRPMKEWPWFQKGAISTDSQYKHKFGSPKLSDDCYFAFQSNNMFGIEGHINCVNSLEEFK
jgi:hypothetical protein